MLRESYRFILRYVLILLSKLLFKLTITGREHLPAGGPLIIISNHFSWFEPPLIALNLPYRVVFLAAAELMDSFLFRVLSYAIEMIPVHRGRPDRSALKQAEQLLEAGAVLLIFPEGGIDPDLLPLTAQGKPAALAGGKNARESKALIPARPGAAFLAVRTQAPILPVAFLGTEEGQTNMRRLRRTKASMRVGPVFGPLSLSEELHGRARRQALDQLGHDMMRALGRLLPPENRGPYT